MKDSMKICHFLTLFSADATATTFQQRRTYFDWMQLAEKDPKSATKKMARTKGHRIMSAKVTKWLLLKNAQDSSSAAQKAQVMHHKKGPSK